MFFHYLVFQSLHSIWSHHSIHLQFVVHNYLLGAGTNTHFFHTMLQTYTELNAHVETQNPAHMEQLFRY